LGRQTIKLNKIITSRIFRFEVSSRVEKKKYKVAVLLDTSRAYDRDVLKGITQFNKLYDTYHFFFHSPRYVHLDGQEKLLKRLAAWKPDGIIVREIPGLDKLTELRIPLIVSPHTHVYERCVNLWADNESIGELAGNYFLAKGYKHFGFVGFNSFHWSQQRAKGFVRALGKAPADVDTFLFDSAHTLWENLPTDLTQWLRRLHKPCALFSATDELNIHLLEAAKEAGYHVPDELAILGVDNDELICEMTQPTLSSIDQNAEQAGFEAASSLLAWMQTDKRPNDLLVVKPKAVIERHSTSTLAIDDEQVRKALSYINAHAPFADIGVSDVVNSITQSRRILEKKFKTLLKSSILDQIKRVRIQRIQYLLANTDLTVQQIAYEMAFGNPANITRYFKQSTGFNPLEYRKKYQTRKAR
jgi:LacI family transcriptional regulator